MKVGVVFEADFIADLSILAFFGLTASLRLWRLEMLYRSNESRWNFVERQIYVKWQTNTFRLPSVLYMYWGFNPCVWVYLLAVWFLSCTQNLLGFSRCAEFHPCNLTSDISVQNFVDKAISPSNLRWLVPVSLFFDSFNFKRSMQKSKPEASQHFCRVGLYNFVISSYHGNWLFGPTF